MWLSSAEFEFHREHLDYVVLCISGGRFKSLLEAERYIDQWEDRGEPQASE